MNLFIKKISIFRFLNFLKRPSFIIALSVLLAVGYWIFFIPSYYFVIPVQIEGEYNTPFIQMEIANRKYLVELAIGSKLSVLSKNDLTEIDKDFCGTVSSFDVHGNDYERDLYQISGIKIHDFFLSKMKIGEESPEFLANKELGGDKDKLPCTGHLCGEVFQGKNFLLDFPQSKIVVCKRVKDLVREFYKLEDFTKVPFFISNKNRICFRVETDTGTKTLLLHTRASDSCIRSSPVEVTLSKDTYRGTPVWHSKKFILGDHDFGKQSLFLINITPRLSEIDGFLGMDFLNKHAIYLDMKKSMAYIAKKASVESAYYSVIPVQVDSEWNIPLIQMEIADKKYDVELDLGYRLSTLSQTNLNEIDKEFCGTSSITDMHGNRYENNVYQISEAKIHNYWLHKMKIQEESPEFLANSILAGNKDTIPYAGRLGREVFQGRNFLLDFSQSKVILCKNFKDLTKDHYKLESFIKVPFLFNKKNGIHFQVETDAGMKTLLLDSGASISILRPPMEEKMEAAEIRYGLPVWSTQKFLFGEHDFGERKFYLFNITSLFGNIDGFLGMDFLKEHAVYLDMEKSVAYIAKSQTANP